MAELSLVDIIKAGGISKARDAQRQVRAQDYQPLLRQLPTTAAAALGPLLTSPDQNAVNQGQSMLAEYMRRRSPEARQGLELGSQQLANAQQQNQATALNMELARNTDSRQASAEQRAAEQFPLVQQNYRLQNQNEVMQQKLLQAKVEALGAPIPAAPYGEPPKGYFPVMAPSGNVEYIPQPGTEPYNKAIEVSKLQANILRNLQMLQTVIDDAGASGTELFGARANTLRFLRGNVLSDVASLRNMGVLQPAELENLESQLPDPTSWSRNIAATFGVLDPTGLSADAMRESIQAPFDQMRQMFEERVRQHRKQFWYIPHVVGVVPEDAK